MNRVCTLGLGYVGLPTASLLASKGFQVHGVDANPKIVETLGRGDIHIYEPDLAILVKSVINSGNLTISGEVVRADIFILAVPTPLKGKQVPDISYVEAATRAIAPYLAAGNLVILESTSPVGTTEKILRWLQELRPELTADDNSVYIAYCPERVLPGQILKELVSNARIVGGIDTDSTEMAAAFYKQFVSGKILRTDARTAELAKLAENAFRDVNVAFANELSLICDRLGIDVWELIELANHHPRVNILQPGAGVGGHCVAVDPWFIVDAAPEQAKLIRTAREVNDSKPDYVVSKVKEKAVKFKKPVIACLGLAFKANVDDLRQSPAVEIVRRLTIEQVGDILVVEPHITILPATLTESRVGTRHHAQPTLNNIQLTNLSTALNQADIVVLLVDHQAFVDVERSLLQDKIIIDTRGVWR